MSRFAYPNDATACYKRAMVDDLKESIAKNAAGPASASGDGQSVSQHSLRDQIAADEYLRQSRASRSRRLPIRIAKVIPGGAA